MSDIQTEATVSELCELSAPDPYCMLEDIICHLGTALGQSTLSDDQVILDHVRRAHEIAKQLGRAQWRRS